MHLSSRSSVLECRGKEMTVELRRYCIRYRRAPRATSGRNPENFTFQPFANPRTGTTIVSLQSAVLSHSPQSVGVASQSRQSEPLVR